MLGSGGLRRGRRAWDEAGRSGRRGLRAGADVVVDRGRRGSDDIRTAVGVTGALDIQMRLEEPHVAVLPPFGFATRISYHTLVGCQAF